MLKNLGKNVTKYNELPESKRLQINLTIVEGLQTHLDNEDCKIAKKAYHFHKGFNIDLDKYEKFGKQDLIDLQNTKSGLIKYVQRVGKLAPIKFINDAKK